LYNITLISEFIINAIKYTIETLRSLKLLHTWHCINIIKVTKILCNNKILISLTIYIIIILNFLLFICLVISRKYDRDLAWTCLIIIYLQKIKICMSHINHLINRPLCINFPCTVDILIVTIIIEYHFCRGLINFRIFNSLIYRSSLPHLIIRAILLLLLIIIKFY
jgi:hypothetical protein